MIVSVKTEIGLIVKRKDGVACMCTRRGGVPIFSAERLRGISV
jgi:hypothetical protein